MSDELLESLVGTRLGGYHLTALLGMGGFAAVYRGESLLNRSIVRAIKVVRPELSSKKEFERRFGEEAGSLELLRHENVVRFHSAQRSDDGWLLMVLEMLDGRTLAAELDELGRRGERMAVARAAELTLQASRGVAAAHAKGVVHRDIKPDNLFVAKTEAGEVVKVLDFGIARAVDEAARHTRATMTAKGAVPGTTAYMAPEVCLEAVPNAAADVYALGMVLYEALAGEHPFLPRGKPPRGTLQLMRAQIDEPIRPIDAVRGDVPKALATVVTRALAKDPKKRYATAAELAGALELAADLSGPVATPPPPPPPRPAAPATMEREEFDAAARARASGAADVRLSPERGEGRGEGRGPADQPARAVARTEDAWTDRHGKPSNTPPTLPSNPAFGLHSATPAADRREIAAFASPPVRAASSRWALPAVGGAAVVAVVVLLVWRPWERAAQTPLPPLVSFAADAGGARPVNGDSPTSPAHTRSAECPDGMARVSAAGVTPFCMDRTEVTVAQYATCVSAGICSAIPAQPDFDVDDVGRWAALCNGASTDREAQPVNCIDHARAATYCERARAVRWPDAGWRLPTQREWRAASGRLSGRTYPWGDASPTQPWRVNACDLDCRAMARQFGLAGAGEVWSVLAESSDGFSATAPVGSFRNGAALDNGVLDLEGNVREWTSDVATGGATFCGSGWLQFQEEQLRGTCRSLRAEERHPDLGFRCVALLR